MTAEEYFRSLKSKRVTVVGFGVSNRPLINMLLDAGADVTVCDKRPIEQLGSDAEALEGRLRFVCGDSYLDDINADIVFKTPGMRRDLPGFLEAGRKGAVLTSEMQVFFELCPCKKIAVTGSEGKTTTSTLISEFLRQQGRTVWLGGNIGTPLLPEISRMKPSDIVVAELSSFQLFDMTVSAETAVITNIVQEHLNWHKDMQEYIDTKKRVFSFRKGGKVVLNDDYATTKDLALGHECDLYKFSFTHRVEKGAYLAPDGIIHFSDGEKDVPVLDRRRIKIIGDHNVENYMAAITATWGLVDISVYGKVAESFGGVEHRMEYVRTKDGVKYFNDSICTSPTSAIACLKSQKDKIVMIAGGSDKKLDYSPVVPYILQKVSHLILMGATARKIYDAVTSDPGYDPGKLNVEFSGSMEDSVQKAQKAATAGQSVYLLPVSASFDCYSNFEERGKHYKKLVNEL